MARQDRLHAALQELRHLLRAAADIAGGLEMGGKRFPVHAKHGVRGDELDQIIGQAKLLYIPPRLLGEDPDATWRACRSPPRFTASIMMFSEAMNGSSSRMCFSMTFSWTTRPDTTFS